MASQDAKHLSQARKIPKRVLLTGSNGDTFVKGQGLCYNSDYGTATENDGERFNRVELPSVSNNRHFAGVLDHNVTIGVTGKTWVTINEPGSICEIAIGVDTVLDTGMVTCSVGEGDAGRFKFKGFAGRGSAIPMQTNASGIDGGEIDGTGSLSTDGLTLTAGAAQFADTVAGDKVFIIGGEDEDGSLYVVPGEYEVASVTSTTVIVLTESAVSATTGAAVTCSYYTMNGNQTCLAKLLDGEESGLVETVTPPNTGGAAVMSYMVGGVTYINGSITIATADANGALADGDQFGLKKGFYCLGAMTTNAVKVTPATAGLQMDKATAFASCTFDAADEVLILRWDGIWVVTGIVGATQA